MLTIFSGMNDYSLTEPQVEEETEPTTWKCEKCGVASALEATRCSMCGNPQPRQKLKQAKSVRLSKPPLKSSPSRAGAFLFIIFTLLSQVLMIFSPCSCTASVEVHSLHSREQRCAKRLHYLWKWRTFAFGVGPGFAKRVPQCCAARTTSSASICAEGVACTYA